MMSVFDLAVKGISMVTVVVIAVIYVISTILLFVKKLQKKKAILLIWLFVSAFVFTILFNKFTQAHTNKDLHSYQIELEGQDPVFEELREEKELFGYSYYNSNGILQFQVTSWGITIHGGDGFVKSISSGTITRVK